MRWSVLKEEKEAEQMFAWKYLIMPILTLPPRPSCCTACILRTQRPGYSPKNTCHLTGCTAK